jgi:hypothetical protein
MIRYKKIFPKILVIAVLCTACAPVYMPNTNNAPMFAEKGNLMIAAFGGSNGFDGQLAYSITDHFAIMANGAYQSKSTDSNDLQTYHKHMFGEFGLGYYSRLGKIARFGCYGGYGLGQAETGYDYTFFNHYSGVVNGMYERLFIQTDFGLTSTFDIVTSGVSVRGSYVHFYKFTSDLQEIKTSVSNYYFEPAVFVRVGWKYVKFQFQFSGSILMNDYPEFDNQPYMFSGGLVFTIPMMLAK